MQEHYDKIQQLIRTMVIYILSRVPWFAREQVISGFNKKAAAKKLPTRVFHDFTTSRFKLLNYARKEVAKRLEFAGISEDMQKKLPGSAKMFAFSTPNCELWLRQNGRVHKFFSENQVKWIF